VTAGGLVLPGLMAREWHDGVRHLMSARRNMIRPPPASRASHGPENRLRSLATGYVIWRRRRRLWSSQSWRILSGSPLRTWTSAHDDERTSCLQRLSRTERRIGTRHQDDGVHGPGRADCLVMPLAARLMRLPRRESSQGKDRYLPGVGLDLVLEFADMRRGCVCTPGTAWPPAMGVISRLCAEQFRRSVPGGGARYAPDPR
jgi:hypothetical protein